MKPSLIKRVCWGNTLFFIMVASLFVVTLLSSCGTKGDLYIPDTNNPSKLKIITKD